MKNNLFYNSFSSVYTWREIIYFFQTLHRDSEITDINDKPMRAMDVFSICIKHLKDSMLIEMNKRVVSPIKEDDVDFVLTVPAIWGDAAKMFMREAAVKVSFLHAKISQNYFWDCVEIARIASSFPENSHVHLCCRAFPFIRYSNLINNRNKILNTVNDYHDLLLIHDANMWHKIYKWLTSVMCMNLAKYPMSLWNIVTSRPHTEQNDHGDHRDKK